MASFSVETERVVDGELYEEVHQLRSFDEFCLGRWRRYGSEVYSNPSNEGLICKYCQNDFMKNRNSHYELLFSMKERSYQVKGFTHPHEKWSWIKSTCTNPSACYGKGELNGIVKVFDIRRRDNPLEPHSKQYKFSMLNMSSGGSTTVLDSFYVNVKQAERTSQHACTGIASKKGRPNFIVPNIFDDQPSDGQYYAYVDISSRRGLPEDLEPDTVNNWPSVYKRRMYLYPTTLSFEWFRAIDDAFRSDVPSRPQELDEKCEPIAQVFVNIYPGGNAMQTHFWKWLKVSDEKEPYKWSHNDLVLKDLYGIKIGSFWHNNEDYPNPPTSVYVPSERSGYGGPLTTYWKRIDSCNRFFS